MLGFFCVVIDTNEDYAAGKTKNHPSTLPFIKKNFVFLP